MRKSIVFPMSVACATIASSYSFGQLGGVIGGVVGGVVGGAATVVGGAATVVGGALEQGRKEADKVVEGAKTATTGLQKVTQEQLKRLEEGASNQLKQSIREAGKQIQQSLDDTRKALTDVENNGRKAIKDYVENTVKAVQDTVDAAHAAGRFAERTVEGYRDTLSNAERRVREGKVVDAVWHAYIEPLQKQDDNAAKAAQESEVINAAFATAASAYGGPAGSAAYSAWFAYKQTGDVNLALKAGLINGLKSAAIPDVASMPAGTVGEITKKAVFTGAVGGIAVAAAGGDQAAVQDAFIKQGGMVIVQAGQAYASKQIQSASGSIDSYCSSAVGVSCKPILSAVKRDKDGNVIFNNRGLPDIDLNAPIVAGREKLGYWGDEMKVKAEKSIPGVRSIAAFNDEWVISYDLDKLKSKVVRQPAISVTFIGKGSPFASKIKELAAIHKLGKPPEAVNTKPDTADQPWVALGGFASGGTDRPIEFFTRSLPIKGDPKRVDAGQVLTSIKDVNMRKGAADWEGKIGVLKQGQTIVVLETKAYSTTNGTPQQLWAKVDVVD